MPRDLEEQLSEPFAEYSEDGEEEEDGRRVRRRRW